MLASLGTGPRVARIAGIAIRVDWSVALVALLFVFDFTARLTAAGTPATVAVLGGMLAAILFFGSILAHELAHALVARLGGIQTRDIALHVFGGLARLSGEPRSGRQEIAIAGAGPAMNWVLAAGFAGPALALRAGSGPVFETLAMVLGWAAGANAVLGGLNLLPAFPLDGGRVLRGYLWHRWRDLPRATQAAARASRGLAWGGAGLAIWSLASGNVAGGLLVGFLAFLMAQAARSEAARAAARQGMDDAPWLARDRRGPGGVHRDPLSPPFDLVGWPLPPGPRGPRVRRFHLPDGRRIEIIDD